MKTEVKARIKRTDEVISEVADRMGCFKKDARALLLRHFRDCLLAAFVRGEAVRVAGIGTFYPAWKRRGRIPTLRPRQLTVRFRPAKGFVRELNRLTDSGCPGADWNFSGALSSIEESSHNTP